MSDLFGSAMPHGQPAKPIGEVLSNIKPRGRGMSVQKHIAAPDDRAAQRKSNKAKERLWHSKTRELYMEEGWFERRVDETVSTQYGTFTRDAMGFADREAWKPREGGGLDIALIQICAKEGAGAHLQKMANPKNTIDFEDRKGVPIRTLVEEVLSIGVQIHLVAFEKIGSRWICKRLIVNTDKLIEADERRRK